MTRKENIALLLYFTNMLPYTTTITTTTFVPNI